jgi:hypothetical protein
MAKIGIGAAVLGLLGFFGGVGCCNPLKIELTIIPAESREHDGGMGIGFGGYHSHDVTEGTDGTWTIYSSANCNPNPCKYTIPVNGYLVFIWDGGTVQNQEGGNSPSLTFFHQ